LKFVVGHEGAKTRRKLDADFAGYAEIFRHGLTLLFFTTEVAEIAEKHSHKKAQKHPPSLKLRRTGEEKLDTDFTDLHPASLRNFAVAGRFLRLVNEGESFLIKVTGRW
jgi:hypothetical protein